MSLTATVQTKLTSNFSEDASLADLKDVVNQAYKQQFTDGTADEQAEQIYRERISVGALATVTRDLQSVNNPKGDALNFSEVKYITVINYGTADSETQAKESGEDIDLSASTFPGIDGVIESGGWAEKCTPFAGVTIGAGNKDLSFENTGTKTIYVDVIAIGIPV